MHDFKNQEFVLIVEDLLIKYKMDSNWFDIYDIESAEKPFENVNYYNYAKKLAENEEIKAEVTTPLEGIVQEALIRVWRSINYICYQENHSEIHHKITVYIESEFRYAKDS